MTQATIEYKLVPSAEFKSGLVRQRLRRVRAAASHAPDFYDKALSAIERSQPKDVDISEIDIIPGATWIPKHQYVAFCEQVLGVMVHLTHAESTNYWDLSPISGNASATTANTSTYGMSWGDMTWKGNLKEKELTGVDLIEMAMNAKTPYIKVRKVPETKAQHDPTLTSIACEKQQRLKDRFEEWCRSDPDRAMQLQHIYNHRCNNIVLRQYDGSFLSLSNVSPFWQKRLKDPSRKYQLDSIYRGLVGNTIGDEMCGFGVYLNVGFGKTATGVAIGYENVLHKRFAKVMFVVQRKTLLDFATTIRQMYPQAKVLVATSDDLSKHKRQLFMARAAYGKWDLIVCTHEAFGRLMLKWGTIRDYVDEQLDRLNDDEAHIKAEAGSAEIDEDTNKSLKSLERRRNRLEEKLKNLDDRHDEGLCFEDLGVDALIVDEADLYKNRYYYTKFCNIAGLPRSKSNRGEDFDIKKWWLTKTYGDGRLIKMTGTFISNSLVELWHELMDLAPKQMKSRGWHVFDAWAASCGKTKTGATIKNTGRMEPQTKFAEFVNLAEQLQLLYSVAEIKADDAPDVEIQKPKPKYRNITTPMSQTQRDYMDYLIERTDLIRAKTPMQFPNYDADGNVLTRIIKDEFGDKIEVPDIMVDNNLLVTTAGRKEFLDPRLNDPEADDNPKSKANICVRRVFRLWRKFQAQRYTQVIFCDMGVPGSDGFCLYHDMVEKLVAMGIPRHEIAIAQDYKTDKKTQWLHEQVRTGEIRVLIASTETAGVGVNIQDLLIALHHLDPKWRPRDMQQREGRILRPGNLHERVLVYRYITQGVDGNVGFDSFMWDKLLVKIKFIRQLFTGNMNVRRLEEDASEDPIFATAEIVALCTGDARIMTYVSLCADLELRKRLVVGYQNEIRDMSSWWGRPGTSIKATENRVEDLEKSLLRYEEQWEQFDRVLPQMDGEFSMVILDEEFTNRVAAGKRLNEIADNMLTELTLYNRDTRFTKNWNYQTVGMYHGMQLKLEVEVSGLQKYRLEGVMSFGDRLLRDHYQTVNRIDQELYNFEENWQRKIEELDNARKMLVEINRELESKQAALAVMKESAITMERDKLALEQELGLNPKEDEMAVVEFDEQSSD